MAGCRTVFVHSPYTSEGWAAAQKDSKTPNMPLTGLSASEPFTVAAAEMKAGQFVLPNSPISSSIGFPSACSTPGVLTSPSLLPRPPPRVGGPNSSSQVSKWNPPAAVITQSAVSRVREAQPQERARLLAGTGAQATTLCVLATLEQQRGRCGIPNPISTPYGACNSNSSSFRSPSQSCWSAFPGEMFLEGRGNLQLTLPKWVPISEAPAVSARNNALQLRPPHGGVSVYAPGCGPCTHISCWRRLRAKRGYGHYACTLCGLRWKVFRPRAAAAGVATCSLGCVNSPLLGTDADQVPYSTCV